MKNSSNNVPLHKAMSCLVDPTVQMLKRVFQPLFSFAPPLSRHEQPRGAGAGGARLPDAVPAGLPHVPARADGAVLEEGPGGEAHLRVPAGLFGGLLHCHWASVPAGGQPLSTAAFISCHFTGSPPGVARLHPFSLSPPFPLSLSLSLSLILWLWRSLKKNKLMDWLLWLPSFNTELGALTAYWLSNQGMFFFLFVLFWFGFFWRKRKRRRRRRRGHWGDWGV